MEHQGSERVNAGCRRRIPKGRGKGDDRNMGYLDDGKMGYVDEMKAKD